MPENTLTAAAYTGQTAIDRFRASVYAYMQDEATAQCYVMYRQGWTCLHMYGVTTGLILTKIVNAMSSNDSVRELDQYEMIVIESRNAHADTWIATFYPRQCVTTVVEQLASRQNTANASTCHSQHNESVPIPQEVQGKQMQCMMAAPALPVLETKHNHASIRSICPVCTDMFKPPIGEWGFLAGTWHPVCEGCISKVEKQTIEQYPF